MRDPEGGNSRPVESCRQADVSKRQRGEGSGKGELTPCRIVPPGEHQQAAEAKDPEGGTHKLSGQAARRTSASRQRGEGSVRGNSHPVGSSRPADVRKPAAWRGIRKGGTHKLSDQAARRTSASRQRGEESGTGSSLSIRSSSQGYPAGNIARVLEEGLTSYSVKPPGKRQQAGSATWDPEGKAHKLSDRTASVSKPAARHEILKGKLNIYQIKPSGKR